MFLIFFNRNALQFAGLDINQGGVVVPGHRYVPPHMRNGIATPGAGDFAKEGPVPPVAFPQQVAAAPPQQHFRQNYAGPPRGGIGGGPRRGDGGNNSMRGNSNYGGRGGYSNQGGYQEQNPQWNGQQYK